MSGEEDGNSGFMVSGFKDIGDIVERVDGEAKRGQQVFAGVPQDAVSLVSGLGPVRASRNPGDQFMRGKETLVAQAG